MCMYFWCLLGCCLWETTISSCVKSEVLCWGWCGCLLSVARLLQKKKQTHHQIQFLCSYRCSDVCLIRISVVCMSLDGPHTDHRGREKCAWWRAERKKRRRKKFPPFFQIRSNCWLLLHFFQGGQRMVREEEMNLKIRQRQGLICVVCVCTIFCPFGGLSCLLFGCALAWHPPTTLQLLSLLTHRQISRARKTLALFLLFLKRITQLGAWGGP